MRNDRGQGTVEYVAVVLLAAVVLAGTATAAAATGAGADFATAVPHQMMRALCIVTHGDCDRDRAPCDVASSTASSSWSATVAVFRIGHDRVLVVERRSDRKVVVTLTDAPSGGLRTVNGASARIDHGRRRLSLGGAISASAVASLGHGKTWVLADDSSAKAFVAALERGDPVRDPDAEVRRGELDLSLSGSRSAGDGISAGATLTGTVRGAAGVRTNHVTGETTYFLDSGADLVLDASASLRSLRAAASGQAAGSGRLALTVDASGRWIDLAVVATGELSASARLPSNAGPIADALNVPTSGGRRWLAEAHLDLNEPANLAAAHAVVQRLVAVPPRPRATAAAVAELARRIDERAVVDLRAYALDRSTDGFAVQAGDGAGVGVSHDSSTEHTRLIAARTRGLDGQWGRRADCLKEARA